MRGIFCILNAYAILLGSNGLVFDCPCVAGVLCFWCCWYQHHQCRRFCNRHRRSDVGVAIYSIAISDDSHIMSMTGVHTHTYVCCVWPNTLNDSRTHPCGIHNLPRWKAVYARNMSIHSIEAYSFISFFHAHALPLPFLCAPILIRLFTRTYLIWRKSKICHYL